MVRSDLSLIKLLKKASFVLNLFFFASLLNATGQDADHWETAIFNNDNWRYFVGNSEPPSEWRSLSFAEEAWPLGQGGFGYSDGDDNTVIPQCNSVFIRKKFNIPDTAVITMAILNMDYDDAFVAYLNGVEIARAGITGSYPAYNQTGTDHEAKMYYGGLPESFIIYKETLKSCLLPGENVLSIQVHNSSITSSDLTSNAFLSFGISNSFTYFRPNPSWFTAPHNFTSSNLPIVIINTVGGVSIPDDPRVVADMKIIDRGENLINHLSDQNNIDYLKYNGKIDIEIRGSSSQVDPKKQYGFSTRKADGVTPNNVSLLGLPADNDWILNGLVFEPSHIRNYLCYNLSRMIGEYASRTVYCEVVLNGQYQGLYLLLEKIKQGHDRVNITDIDRSDNSMPDITGGYITKADKTTGNDPVAWTMSSPLGTDDVTFIHEQPKPEVVTPSQNSYIRGEFQKLSYTASTGNTSFINGYPSVIDVPSFIDYMIINELSANVDAYQFSSYFHKDRNGKLRAGPIWDQDLTFGYDLFFWGADRSKTYLWQFANGDNEGPSFWNDLFNDQKFSCSLAKRWNELIKPGKPLNFSVIDNFIDQTDLVINDAVNRDIALWNPEINHAEEINKIKSFIQERTTWMTNNLALYTCEIPKLPPLVISKIMYYPDSTFAYPESKQQEFIEISNTSSESVNLTGVYFSGTGLVYQFPASSFIGPQGKVILASNRSVFLSKYKVPVFDQYTRNLSNTGESLVLADGMGNVIDSVSYSSDAPWPDASGNGYYLELSDLSSDNSKAENWVAGNSQIVSVEDPVDDGGIKVYPGVVNDILKVEVTGGKYILQLYDYSGIQLKSIDVNSTSFTLDMGSYNSGLYLVRIVRGGRSSVRKIIKE
jgi:hypothetical protein